MPEREKSERRARKKTSGPLAAAGLVAFYENFRSKVEISPTTLVVISAATAAAVVLARAIVH
ncbi:MAG: preprotein translocase subunit Sec61beta [Acidilobus sp.]|nr:preprotein translocase subunit Sec61beta [Acidilobus sp.]